MVSACLLKLRHNRLKEQGFHRRCTLLKYLLIFLSLTLFTAPQALADSYGELGSKTMISLHEERIHNLVASSADIRNSIEGGRSVAGRSPQEEAWAQEFESLMENSEEKDYLEMALKL